MPSQTPDTELLIRLFYDSVAELADFDRVGHVQPPYQSLLDHDQHMTVTVENFHESKVDVEVLEVKDNDDQYARKILLRRQTDRAVVQFGIVRLKLNFLSSPVRELIRAKQVPLGRVLIENGVMRQVELVQLWNLQPGKELSECFGSDQPTCGRTALIHVDNEPAVELLEIVAPVPIVN